MRLIDADALINELIECKQGYVGTHNDVVLHDLVCDNAIAWADGTETVEAVPVVHGKWIHTGRVNLYSGHEHKCSVCGYTVMFSPMCDDENYCGSCGAKMDDV